MNINIKSMEDIKDKQTIDTKKRKQVRFIENKEFGKREYINENKREYLNDKSDDINKDYVNIEKKDNYKSNNVNMYNIKPERKDEIIYKRENSNIENIMTSLQLNKYFNLIFVIVCVFFGYLNQSILRGLLTGIFVYVWAYGAHILAHKYSFFRYFHSFHHDETITRTWYAQLIETLVNIVGCGGLSILVLNLIIERKYDVLLLDNDILLLMTFLYTSYHMINYHVLDVPTHKGHHTYVYSNYGPDIMDIIFDTKQDGDTFEDMNSAVFNTVIIAVFIYFTRGTKLDIIEWIRRFINRYI